MPPRPARLFFDLWSLVYDQPVVQRLTYRPVHDAVLEELAIRPPGRLLDLGCGTGLLTHRLRAELHAATIVGCDYSAGMLRQARARSPRGLFTHGDAQRLPFADANFDTVVSTEAFHWFPDQPAALREIRRILKPGGRLLVALVNPPVEAVSDVAWWTSRVAGQPFYWPTAARMRALLAGAGFAVAAQRRIWRLPAGLLLPPVLSVGVRP